MKKNPYCNKDEIAQMVLLSGICRSLPPVIEQTSDPKWCRKMRTAVTYLENVLKERISYIPKEAQVGLARRAEHTVVKFMTSDALKMDPDKGFKSCDKTITMDFEDYLDIYELASQGCFTCSQGDCVKDCKWRKLFHKHGIPVYRENPAPGKCEFRYDDEIKVVDPFTLQKVFDMI